MSTYRDISTLSLDGLRSATYSADSMDERQQPPSASRKATWTHCTGANMVSNVGMSNNQNDSILATNKKLSDENRDLRRCLSLLMENSQLKTMNVLSAVMAICDDKLSNFLTECLMSNDSPMKTMTRANTTETFRQPKNEKASSPSYGKSFANVGLSDLADSTFQASPDRERKARSPVNSHSRTSSTPPPHPPMKFGFGQSPYHQSELKMASEQPFSTKSHRTEDRQHHCKRRSKTRSHSRSKCCTNINMEETQVKPSAAMCAQQSSSPALPRKFIAQKTEYQDSNMYSECDSHTSQAVKGVRHCRSCGVNLVPKCSCQSPRTLTRIEESTDTSMAPVYFSGKQQLPGGKQSTSAFSNHEPAQQSVFHNISVNQEDSFRKPSNPASDRTGTVFKKLVSKVINLRHIPEDRSQPNDDYVIEKFRREKKKYERILAASNESDDQSTQTTNADTETIDGNFTTDDQLTTYGNDGTINHAVDVDSHAVQPVKREYVSRNKTTPRNETHRQGEVCERLGTPQATSTPLPSPVKKFSEFRESKLAPSWLASIMGITGKDSQGKAEYILHRPVDVLIGYNPNISEQASYMLTVSTPNKRIVGEIAFQLDRRILEFVFSVIKDSHASKRSSRYYGYSVSSIMLLIDKEVRKADNDPEVERKLKVRLDIITGNLFRFGYDYKRHSEFTQDMVNKYGLLNGPPDPSTVEEFGLSEPAVLRILLGQLVKDTQELDDMLILLDCLHYMAHKDKRPLFMW